MKVSELLRSVEELPELSIGDRNIRHLRHFLCGYISALYEYRPDDVDWDFRMFNAFLAERYQDSRSVDWATLIETHEPDGSSTDAFFRLLHAFYEQNPSTKYCNEKK